MTQQTIHLMIVCLILALILTTGCITTRQMEPVSDEKFADMQSSLDTFVPSLEEQLNEIFILTNSTAGNLTGTKTDTALEQAFLQLRRDIPASYEVGLFSADNTYLAVTGNLENQDIIGQEACISITEEDFTNTTNGCIITLPITFITGETGIMVIAPVYDEKGTYTTSLRVSLNPAYLFAGPVSQLKTEEGYTIWAMQPDGIQIYDEDIQELNKNALTDPLYSETTVKNAIHRVSCRKTGKRIIHVSKRRMDRIYSSKCRLGYFNAPKQH